MSILCVCVQNQVIKYITRFQGRNPEAKQFAYKTPRKQVPMHLFLVRKTKYFNLVLRVFIKYITRL